MAQLSMERRRVVILAASVAMFSAVIPLVIRSHHRVGLALLGAEVVLLVYVMVQFAKVMRAPR